MTLSDREYQALRDAAAAVIRAVGVETGGSNVQFAVNRETGEIVVIEMNPRVSRSSALASKATGYPIAKVATRLAVGYTLDEIPNDITGTTPASFEPTIDYVVVKAPRFAFEKFPGADETLTTQMKSVGEAMGIGRSFGEAYGKAMRSRELDRAAARGRRARPRPPGTASTRCSAACARARIPTRSSAESSIAPLVLPRARATRRARATTRRPGGLDGSRRRGAARCSSTTASPTRASRASAACDEDAVRARRRELGVRPVFKTVDSCAGEVAAETSVPLLDLRPDRRAARRRPPDGADPGLRPEPHRPGHRVRLLLRPGRARSARQGYDDGDGQLQPRDRLDRLRHGRPAVLRAAHGRGRARGRRARAARRRRRAVRRPDAAQARAPRWSTRACRSSARARRRSTWPRTASASATCSPSSACAPPDWAIADDADEAARRRRAHRLPGARAPVATCSAAARCASATTPAELRSAPVAPNTLVDRFVEDAIEIDVDAVCDGDDARRSAR